MRFSLCALRFNLMDGLLRGMVRTFGSVPFVAPFAIGIPVVALRLTMGRMQGCETEGSPGAVVAPRQGARPTVGSKTKELAIATVRRGC
jgi:hypothetical protein